MERKLATVLFVDLVGSTALVTGTDPEIARRRVQQYFDKVSHCVVTHGGIVEKFGTIHVSNLMVMDPRSKEPTRVGRKRLEDGRNVRYARRSGEIIDQQ